MATSAKALHLANELADTLAKRVSLAIKQGFDSSLDGPHPTIFVGPGGAGTESMFIRVKQIDWPLAQDVVGTNRVYTPHVIQIVTEANAAATTGCGFFTLANLTAILGEIIGKGCRVEWYQSPNGNAVDVTDITATNKKASFDSHLYWGIRSGS